jgi:hypothetical protein
MEELKKEVANLIKTRIAAEGAGLHGNMKPIAPGTMPPHAISGLSGPKISGTELAKIGPIIAEIDDPVIQNQVRGYFAMATKFQALGIITSDRSEICRRYPAIAAKIAEVATEMERKIAESNKKSLHY